MQLFDIHRFRRAVGGSPADRHAADFWHARRTPVRAGGRAQSRHRGHHDLRRDDRLAFRLSRRRPLDRHADRCGGRRGLRPAACGPDGIAGPLPACLRSWRHAVCLQLQLLCLPADRAACQYAAHRRAVPADRHSWPLDAALHRAGPLHADGADLSRDRRLPC